MTTIGICYTQSGTEKRYEPEQFAYIPKTVTAYTVGYPSSAYYPDGSEVLTKVFLYPNGNDFGPPTPDYGPGMAKYLCQCNTTDEVNQKIYGLMSYNPPYGYELYKNGPYTYIAYATVYNYNFDIRYGNAIKTITSSSIIKKEFKYRKIDYGFNINVRVYISIAGNGGDVCAQIESYNFTDMPMNTLFDMLMDDLNTSVVVAVGLNNGGVNQVNCELSRRTFNSLSGMPHFKSSIYSSSGLSGMIGFYTIDNRKTTITSTHNGIKYNVNYHIY